MKTAVITGHNGQDGHYLAAHLAARGYRVVGLSPATTPVPTTLETALELLQREQPTEIYHLAAIHHSAQEAISDDWDVFRRSHEVHTVATAALLEAIKRQSPATRLFYAASCHLFGAPAAPVQDETTPFRPTGLYAITKQAGVELCRYYRQTHGLPASVGILFNHESPRRAPHFVTRKIVTAAVAIRRGGGEPLRLGNLDAVVDWGFAGDYVAAMHAILQLPAADDFVIATGKPHTIREFVELAFGELQLDWRKHVIEDPRLLRAPTRTPYVGNPGKLRAATGWEPQTSFPDLVRLMVRAEWENKPGE